jgi:DNA-binding transcriptional LysR family regulator
MDRLESMTVLLAVVAAGSLSAAARELRTPLATVSRKVADLEQRLGTSLLVRRSRRVELTASGRAYVEAIRPLLEQLAEAERVAAGEYRAPQGELAVTAPVLFGRVYVLPLLVEFLLEHPKIQGRAMLVDRHVDLLEERIDVAIRIGELSDPTLVAARVGTVQRVVCASPAYLARRGIPSRPEDLQGHEAITFRGFTASRGWTFRRQGGPFTIDVSPRLTVNSAEAAVDAARAGLGFTRVLSYQVERELREGELQEVLSEFAPSAIPVSLVYSGRARLPAKARAFIDWALDRLRARLAKASPAAPQRSRKT